jgi:hypothetical protein
MSQIETRVRQPLAYVRYNSAFGNIHAAHGRELKEHLRSGSPHIRACRHRKM